MNFKKLALTGAIALGTTLTSLAAYAQQTITVNTTAAGGNAALLAAGA